MVRLIYRKNKQNIGFTIVELLIVIVVIAILAAISVVAYNGIRERAGNTAAYQELKQWHQLFELYKAQNGTYPILTKRNSVNNSLDFCLGTGAMSNGTRCLNNNITSSDELNNALKTIATLPTGPRDTNVSKLGAGPIAVYSTLETPQVIFTYFNGSGDCPSGTIFRWRGSSSYACEIRLS